MSNITLSDTAILNELTNIVHFPKQKLIETRFSIETVLGVYKENTLKIVTEEYTGKKQEIIQQHEFTVFLSVKEKFGGVKLAEIPNSQAYSIEEICSFASKKQLNRLTIAYSPKNHRYYISLFNIYLFNTKVVIASFFNRKEVKIATITNESLDIHDKQYSPKFLQVLLGTDDLLKFAHRIMYSVGKNHIAKMEFANIPDVLWCVNKDLLPTIDNTMPIDDIKEIMKIYRNTHELYTKYFNLIEYTSFPPVTVIPNDNLSYNAMYNVDTHCITLTQPNSLDCYHEVAHYMYEEIRTNKLPNTSADSVNKFLVQKKKTYDYLLYIKQYYSANKINYYNSSTEVWARLLESYLFCLENHSEYTKLVTDESTRRHNTLNTLQELTEFEDFCVQNNIIKDYFLKSVTSNSSVPTPDYKKNILDNLDSWLG